jgi:hypothetical protein
VSILALLAGQLVRLRWDALIFVPLTLWVILSVSRGRSSVARWIFTAFYALGFILAAYGFAAKMARVEDITAAAWGLTIASVAQLWLLWSSDTSRWLASSKRGAEVAL